MGGVILEIACDESGFSGSNLLDRATPVFTHASVDLGIEEATQLIEALRPEFRWPLGEFKSGHLLRGNRAAELSASFLSALHGRAHVHVIDKEYFLVTRIVDLFLAEPSYAAGTRLTEHHRPAALALYRAGRSGGRDWGDFLTAFVELARTKRRLRPERSLMDAFFRARDSLARSRRGSEADGVLEELSRTRVRKVVSRLAHDPSIPPPLEPMLPALAETVLFWSGGRRRVLVIHDEQSALTPSRLTRLQHVLANGSGSRAADLHDAAGPAAPFSPLAGLVTVDSRDDPRVQVADLLAGIARRTVNTADDHLLAPFVSATSLRAPGP
jgi:hypothetical protein